MKGEEALEMLQKGMVREWNGYRASHPEWKPDLSGLDVLAKTGC
jgi:hypothetical protein